MKQEVAVIIPYYRNDLSITEQISYEQCKKVLHKFPIIFVVPESFQMVMEKLPKKWDIVEVPSQWMSSVEAYNQMMLNSSFYQLFQQYRFILIYQLDAYVFSDRLLEFCGYEYDYIGAPWIEGKFEMDLADRGILYVGNGGFSLRRVDSCLRQLEKENLGQVNYNEDVFWASRTEDFKIAPKEIAWQFSFERPVKALYRLNGEQLPFGCHAWMKYDLEFFKPYIAKDGHASVWNVYHEPQWDLINAYIDQRYLTASKDMIWRSILKNCEIVPRNIWIYGAGNYGLLCGYLLHNLKDCRVVYADQNKERWDKSIWKIPIMSPTEIKHTGETLVIVAMKYAEAVIGELLEVGYMRGVDLMEFTALMCTINSSLMSQAD
jgi:hypothetical protein